MHCPGFYGFAKSYLNHFSGFIKDTTGSYDLIFYIGVAGSMYIAIATIVVVICRKYCKAANTYKSPKVEYSPMEGTEEEEKETSLNTRLLNGSVPQQDYKSFLCAGENDIATSSDRHVTGNHNFNFDIDTASVIYGTNNETRTSNETSLFSKTL